MTPGGIEIDGTASGSAARTRAQAQAQLAAAGLLDVVDVTTHDRGLRLRLRPAVAAEWAPDFDTT